MRSPQTTILRVHDAWNGWRTADVRLGDLQDVHWLRPSGAAHRFVHGRVACARILTGAVPHRCGGANCPQSFLVCVLKRHTSPDVYAELARRADAHGGLVVLAPADEASIAPRAAVVPSRPNRRLVLAAAASGLLAVAFRRQLTRQVTLMVERRRGSQSRAAEHRGRAGKWERMWSAQAVQEASL